MVKISMNDMDDFVVSYALPGRHIPTDPLFNRYPDSFRMSSKFGGIHALDRGNTI